VAVEETFQYKGVFGYRRFFWKHKNRRTSKSVVFTSFRGETKRKRWRDL